MSSSLTTLPDSIEGASLTGRDFGPSGAIAAPTRPPVLTGIDVLRAEGFAALRNKRVGLVTNHTGRARDGATTIDLIHKARDVKLVALFSRAEARDFADVYVLAQRFDRTTLLARAHEVDPGFDQAGAR